MTSLDALPGYPQGRISRAIEKLGDGLEKLTNKVGFIRRGREKKQRAYDQDRPHFDNPC